MKHRSVGILTHVRRHFGQLTRLRAQRLDYVLVPAPSPQALRLARSLRPGRTIAAPTVYRVGTHEVERSFELGAALGIAGSPGPMRVFPEGEMARKLRRRIGDGPTFAVHISARRPAQRWPIDRYEIGRASCRERV